MATAFCRGRRARTPITAATPLALFACTSSSQHYHCTAPPHSHETGPDWQRGMAVATQPANTRGLPAGRHRSDGGRHDTASTAPPGVDGCCILALRHMPYWQRACPYARAGTRATTRYHTNTTTTSAHCGRDGTGRPASSDYPAQGIGVHAALSNTRLLREKRMNKRAGGGG